MLTGELLDHPSTILLYSKHYTYVSVPGTNIDGMCIVLKWMLAKDIKRNWSIGSTAYVTLYHTLWPMIKFTLVAIYKLYVTVA